MADTCRRCNREHAQRERGIRCLSCDAPNVFDYHGLCDACTAGQAGNAVIGVLAALAIETVIFFALVLVVVLR